MVQESGAYTDQRKHEVEAKEMPLHKLSATIRHARAPSTADLELGVRTEQVERYAHAERPGKIQ